eukprot:11711215-Ditylum_brightwellii.AAC.1
MGFGLMGFPQHSFPFSCTELIIKQEGLKDRDGHVVPYLALGGSREAREHKRGGDKVEDGKIYYSLECCTKYFTSFLCYMKEQMGSESQRALMLLLGVFIMLVM